MNNDENLVRDKKIVDEKKDNKIGKKLSGISIALVMFSISTFFIDIDYGFKKYLVSVGVISFLIGLFLAIFTLIVFPSDKGERTIGLIALFVVIFTGVCLFLLAGSCKNTIKPNEGNVSIHAID